MKILVGFDGSRVSEGKGNHHRCQTPVKSRQTRIWLNGPVRNIKCALSRCDHQIRAPQNGGLMIQNAATCMV
jgi:hypothetical protein